MGKKSKSGKKTDKNQSTFVISEPEGYVKLTKPKPEKKQNTFEISEPEGYVKPPKPTRAQSSSEENRERKDGASSSKQSNLTDDQKQTDYKQEDKKRKAGDKPGDIASQNATKLSKSEVGNSKQGKNKNEREKSNQSNKPQSGEESVAISNLNLNEMRKDHDWDAEGYTPPQMDNKSEQSNRDLKNFNSQKNQSSKYKNNSKPNQRSSDLSNIKFDDNMSAFDNEYKKGEINNNILEEKLGDLFTASDDYALAHCVAQDMKMGSGIATTFRTKFHRYIGELENQRAKQGGLAFCQTEEGRYIYYLVTKRESNGKPTYETMWRSLVKLREYLLKHEVNKLAIPRIGCGLDRLEWKKVRSMLEYIFNGLGIEIVVYSLEENQLEDDQQQSQPKPKPLVRVYHENKKITEIGAQTLILYFGAADGSISETMKNLDSKFSIQKDFGRGRTTLGTVIKSDRNRQNYVLYGLIVKQKGNSAMDYQVLQKCIYDVIKQNRDDKYLYVAFEYYEDNFDEDLTTTKILNVLKVSFRNVDIYVCNSPLAQ